MCCLNETGESWTTKVFSKDFMRINIPDRVSISDGVTAFTIFALSDEHASRSFEHALFESHRNQYAAKSHAVDF